MVRALGQQPGDVLGADNGDRKCCRGAVDGGQEQLAARTQQTMAGSDDGARIRHVLQHLHAGHHVVAARLFCGQVLGCLHPVINADAGFQTVQTRDLHQLRGQIDGGHLRPFLCQRFAEQAAAAADIQHFGTAQAGAVGHVLQTHRVQRMQRLLRAVGVPPAGGQGGELVQFGLIEIGGSGSCAHIGFLVRPRGAAGCALRRGWYGCGRATGAHWR